MIGLHEDPHLIHTLKLIEYCDYIRVIRIAEDVAANRAAGFAQFCVSVKDYFPLGIVLNSVSN